MERLTYRDSNGRALLTNKGMKIYCSTQATADILCKYEELLNADKPEHYEGMYYCPGCKVPVSKGDLYCHDCGRPINWYNGYDEDET